MENINKFLTNIATEGTLYNDLLRTNLYPNLHLVDAMVSEIALILLDPNKAEKHTKMIEEGWERYWLASVVKNQVRSISSPFHKNNRARISTLGDINSHFNDYDNSEDEKDLLDKVIKEEQNSLLIEARKNVFDDPKSKLTWFDSDMFRLYYDENLTYREIERAYGPPFRSGDP